MRTCAIITRGKLTFVMYVLSCAPSNTQRQRKYTQERRRTIHAVSNECHLDIKYSHANELNTRWNDKWRNKHFRLFNGASGFDFFFPLYTNITVVDQSFTTQRLCIVLIARRFMCVHFRLTVQGTVNPNWDKYYFDWFDRLIASLTLPVSPGDVVVVIICKRGITRVNGSTPWA